MPNRIDVMVLDVGQGSANFVEIYEDVGSPADEKLVATILVDLGCESGSKAARASVEYIQERLLDMDRPTIDALFISHGDGDHHNYLVALTKDFKPARSTNAADVRPVLDISEVWYCGDRSEYTLSNIRGGTPPGARTPLNTLTWLERYMPERARAMPFANDASTFRGWDGASPAPAPFRTVHGVRMYVVAANTVCVASLILGVKRRFGGAVVQESDAYAANTVSLVLLLDYAGAQFVFTGDATGLTIHDCNALISTAVSGEFFTNVKMLTLPHHGAMATGFGLTGPVKPGDDLTVGRARMTTFAAKVQARTITASAGQRKSYGHPDIRVIECFLLPLDTSAYWQDSAAQTGRHYFTAYYEYACDFTREPTGNHWPTAGGKSAGFYTLETATNVYTNLYFLYRKEPWLVYPPTGPTNRLAACTAPATRPLPPLGQTWWYGVKADGTVALQPMENRANPARTRSGRTPAASALVPAVVGPAAQPAAGAPRVRLPGLRVVP